MGSGRTLRESNISQKVSLQAVLEATGVDSDADWYLLQIYIVYVCFLASLESKWGRCGLPRDDHNEGDKEDFEPVKGSERRLGHFEIVRMVFELDGR